MSKRETSLGRIKKPQMFGVSYQSAKRSVLLACVSGSIAGMCMYLFFTKRNIDQYRDFYADYDPEKEFERMRSKNLFDSC